DEDLLELCKLSASGNLPQRQIHFKQEAVICIVLAAEGYPGEVRKNIPIPDLKIIDSLGDIIMFHAGTALTPGGVVSTGGRVLNLTATGRDLLEARKLAYSALERVHVPGLFYRKDIGQKGIP
ncbi:MAG TPA: phosphoribosylglycinamide synthetase C domain-containing protein, partial [Leptospiraceae bacterium]|nr:phosphoribosylglycinamide synthetase C domain-containing protein [Leptospiraceae bacterium]